MPVEVINLGDILLYNWGAPLPSFIAKDQHAEIFLTRSMLKNKESFCNLTKGEFDKIIKNMSKFQPFFPIQHKKETNILTASCTRKGCLVNNSIYIPPPVLDSLPDKKRKTYSERYITVIRLKESPELSRELIEELSKGVTSMAIFLIYGHQREYSISGSILFLRELLRSTIN